MVTAGIAALAMWQARCTVRRVHTAHGAMAFKNFEGQDYSTSTEIRPLIVDFDADAAQSLVTCHSCGVLLAARLRSPRRAAASLPVSLAAGLLG